MFCLFLFLALVPSWAALADLGDTMAQSELKYGEPAATGSPRIWKYVHGPFRIWQTFDDTGHCAIAEFSPLDHASPLSFAQCAELDRANLPTGMVPGVGPGWESVPWISNARGRNTISFQFTGEGGTLYQVIVGQSREADNAQWYDDRVYLNIKGIEMLKAFGEGQ